MTDFSALLRALLDKGVDFILVGGVAATIHGSARLTRDIDVVYSRTSENIARLAEVLAGLHPQLRDAPPGLPFRVDAQTLAAGLNFTLSTDLGDLDLFGEIAGGGTFSALIAGAERVTLFDRQVCCLTIDQLIASKRAAGRARDLEAIAELEIIRDAKRRPPSA